MKLSKSFQMYSKLMPAKEKFYLVLMVIFMLVSVGLETLSIGAMFPFVSLVVDPSRSSSHQATMNHIVNWGNSIFGNHLLIVMAVGLLLVSLIKNLFLYYFIVFQNRLILRNVVNTQSRLFNHYLRAPYLYHLNANTADLIRNITTESPSIFNNVLRTALTIFVDVIMVVAITLLLLFTSTQLTLLVFVGLSSIAVFFNWALKKKLSKYGLTRQETVSRLIKWINQGLGGIKEIKVLGRETYFVNQVGESGRQYCHVESSFGSLSQIPRLFFEVLALAGILTLVVILSLFNKSGHNIIPTIAVFALAGMRLTPAFNRIMGSTATLRYHAPALDLIYTELKRFENLTEDHSTPLLTSLPSPQEGLCLRNISLRYPLSDKEAVNDVTLSVGPSETIGIVGESGAGKTTLINIILGLLEPSQGTISFNGLKLGDGLSHKSNENLVGYVPQDIYLSDDTIKNNVAYGIADQEIDEKKVWEALRRARLEEFVASSPDGLNTWVGERGIRISGGQKQRIGIARALYAEPKLLILDEPTSALDAETEKEIATSIEEISENMMVIVVTHRQGLLTQCNRVFRMVNGHLSEVRQEITSVNERKLRISLT